MPTPLSLKQKRILAMNAREAFREIPQGDIDGQTFDEWRHSEVQRVCGKSGFRCCDQDDYAPLMAHFKHLQGEDGAALNWHVRSSGQPRRVAMAVLMRSIGQAGITRGYAEAICRSIFKCGLEEASESQLWKVNSTVRNRANAKKRKISKEELL
jgi:hypothetical protein